MATKKSKSNTKRGRKAKAGKVDRTKKARHNKVRGGRVPFDQSDFVINTPVAGETVVKPKSYGNGACEVGPEGPGGGKP